MEVMKSGSAAGERGICAGSWLRSTLEAGFEGTKWKGKRVDEMEKGREGDKPDTTRKRLLTRKSVVWVMCRVSLQCFESC